MDGGLLQSAECFFGGGTAIVLALQEYRESADIDFLCASTAGFRSLCEAVWGRGFDGLLREPGSLTAVRELRRDQYGMKAMIRVADSTIKFEIVRESRIALSGAMDDAYGVPVLCRDDMYAEKLLANADRWRDRATLSRDIIDLTMMTARWGPAPATAWSKAEEAYGATVRLSFDGAVARIRDPAWLHHCMKELSMDANLAGELLAVHGGPLARG
jgi:hypothetical protein